MTGIMMSMMISSMDVFSLQLVERHLAVVGDDDMHVVFLEQLGQREGVAQIIVDQQQGSALQRPCRDCAACG